MADYRTNAQELMSAAFKDPDRAGKLLLDIADEEIDLGKLEPIEDAATAALLPYLQAALARIQTEMGVYAKFAGDLADDPQAAIAFILTKVDELIDAKALEPLMDSMTAMVAPFLVKALAAQQAKLAAVEIVAED